MHKDILEKGFLKGDLEHTGSIQASPKKNNKNTSTHCPSTRTQPFHKVKGPTAIEDLARDKRLQTKEFFNL